MPYPFAHPAAVVPLRRLLGRHGVLSALVIGSVVPDLWYFAPGLLERDDTHSLPALFWFCLPIGAALYYAFHRLLKRPLLALWPALAARVAETPIANPAAVCSCIVIGALTHIAWDAVTHVEGWRILQHLSTVGGAALLAWWLRRWWLAAPVRPVHDGLMAWQRTLIATILLLVPAAWALMLALEASWSPRGLLRLATVFALRGATVALLLYSAAWFLARRKSAT